MGGDERLCPMCGHEKVCSVREAKMVFDVSTWGAQPILDKATKVCSWCHSVLLDGEWERLQSVGERAWQLAQASSTHGKDHYVESLTTEDADTAGRSADANGAADAADW